MAATYTPQSDVEYAHAIPRFTTAGGMNENTDFNFTSISEMTDFSGFGSDDYFTGVMVLPVVLIACGVVALFFYNFLIMCRCCLHCLRCAPSEEDINEHPEKVVKSRNRVIFFFGFFVLMTILADHLLYYGKFASANLHSFTAHSYSSSSSSSIYCLELTKKISCLIIYR